jgi:formate-dependent nitrite reductase cytochrome c552 subunit
VPETIPVRAIEDPQDCAECHADEHREWQSSPHANASLSQTFQQQYAASGRPSYCMRCHASGYDPRTEQYVFEGVVCSNCHYPTAGTGHPPGPVEIAIDSQVCGRCHSGEHSPTYDEWLVSAHSAVGIDCADCHTSHNNGLILGNVNETCGSCHEEALVDEIHMGDDMTCVDCHMARVTNAGGVQVISTGHSMNIDPGVCADCHGNTHLLSSDGTLLSDETHTQLAALEAEVTRLEETASQNLNSGIVGGALGALVLALIIFLTIRLGRMK